MLTSLDLLSVSNILLQPMVKLYEF